ncbi:MAG: hypothetical protein ACR2O6_00225, partial [Ilumatobacteraceae bacterium]
MSIESDPPDRVAKRSLAIVVLAAALTAVYLVLPESPGAEAVRVVAPAIGIGAILWGIASFQPRRTLPWALLTVSLGFMAAAAVIWSTLWFRDQDTFPSIGEGFQLCASVLLVVAVALLGRYEREQHDSFGSFETVIVTIAMGLAVWLVVIEPYADDDSLPFADKAWAAAVPFVMVLALALALRWASRTGFDRRAP